MPSQENGQKLRSEEIQDILTRVPHWMIIWGNSLILLIIIIFFILSWVIKYPDIITADAVITSNIPPQREYARASGKIDTILVNNNERVSKGQILGMIENAANLKDVLTLKKHIGRVNTKEQFFSFPIDSIQALTLGEIAPSYNAFEMNYLNFRLNKELKPFTNQLKSNSILKSELKTRLKILQNQKSISKKTYEFSEKTLERNKQLFEKGIISEQEYEDEQAYFLEAEKSLKNINITISQLNQSLNQTDNESSQTIIKSKMENIRLYKSVLLDLNELRRSIRDWELKYLAQANIEGEISLMGIWNEYQTVKQGDLLFTIIPQINNHHIAKIKAPIRNSGKIKKGQQVNINLFNYPEAEYGVLEGKVTEMSAIPDEEGYYFITVFLEKNLLTSYNIQIPFMSEMTGRAEIVTEDLTLLERLFYNMKDIFKT